MTSRTPSVGKGRPSGGRRLIKSRRCSTTNRSRRRYTAKAHATRPGKGQESFAPLFGLPQSHGEGAPVHVVQSQCGHLARRANSEKHRAMA